ncbi:MAG: UDP-3-O-(3-hydroxymyristoyl)glucosamine N-acyltransferase [Rhizomicrobium sp.]
MADPRFYDVRGPFSAAELCMQIGAQAGADVDPAKLVADVATLEGAGPSHLAFCGGKVAARSLVFSQAGFCLLDKDGAAGTPPPGMVVLNCRSALHAFAAAARLFYPDHNTAHWPRPAPIDPTAKFGVDVELGPGVVIGPGAEIGDRTRVGPNSVVGRGVAIGRDCEISGNVTISYAYIGDRVHILPGAQIGQPGFGFASGPSGHVKVPQLGRVIIQDDVEIGAGTTIDRGALGDTVIGEGTKIDNLVQIGHNTKVGRHCMIVAQVGISGSCEIGDFVVLGGQVGVADHVKIGDGARVAAKSGITPGELQAGQDYGGYPARLMKDWRRELAALVLLAKRRKQDRNG